MEKSTGRYVFTKRQHIALLTMLSVEFTLGVLLGTIVPYMPHTVSTAHTIILDTHIGLGILLLSTATVRLVLACLWRGLRLRAVIGLLLVIGAFASGESSVHGGGDTAVFVMAICFLLAFLLYGQTLYTLKKP